MPKFTPTYVGAILSDIHAGAIDAEQWLHELVEGFLAHIKGLKVLDYVIITGDYFDTKISMNAKTAKYALSFLNQLLAVCEDQGAKLRIIKGTESHDNKQLEILSIIAKSSKCDVRIIETVEAEDLFHDFRVLYIPEEYMENKDEYYQNYFDSTYDLIVGHGLVNEALYFAQTQESETTMSKAPVFELDKFLSICRGYIYFGHIHKRIVIKDRFRYVNSYSRWAFGEEDDKGFCMYYYNTKTYESEEEYIVNKLARQFTTIQATCNPTSEVTEKDQVEYLISLADTFLVDYLRMEITVPEEHQNPTLISQMIIETFQKYRNVKIKLYNNAKLRKEKETDEMIKTLLSRFNFVFDGKVPPAEKLVRYIKIKYNIDFNIDTMNKILYESLTRGA